MDRLGALDDRRNTFNKNFLYFCLKTKEKNHFMQRYGTVNKRISQPLFFAF